MANRTLLHGAVTVRSLPVFRAPLDEPVLNGGIIHSPSGELAQVMNGQTMQFLAVVEFMTGISRGGHIHPEREEWFYVQAGEIELLVEHPETHERESVALAPGDIAMIRPGIAHIYVSHSGQALAIEFSSKAYTPAGTEPYSFEATAVV